MVFKTIESSVDKSRTSLALFNKDWNIFKTNWQNASGGFENKFATIFNSNDVNCLKEYNQQIQAGIKPSVAYKNTMMGCTQEAKKNAVAMAKGTMSYQQATSSIKNMSLSAKAGQIALQGLAMAGNMIAMWVITKVIELVGQAIDNYVNAWENASEAIKEHSSAYEEAVSEIETVSTKIEDLDSQIAELNGLDPITSAEDIEKLELEKKILESQLELLKEKRDLEQEEANTAAENYFNTTQKSKINEGTSITTEPTGDYTVDALAPLGAVISSYMSTEEVTPEEELQNAIDKIEEYQKKIGELDSKEDAKEIAELEAKIVDVKTEANTLATTMLENSGSLTDTNRKKEIVDLVTEYNNLTSSVNSYTDAINENSSAQQENSNKTGILSFEEQLSGVESLSKGLDQLSDIYKDVKDAGDFDWSSILNKQEFIDAFGNCGDAYDEFIETITNSPNDIEACQTAFNNLATEYIYNSGVLDDLTEETKDATVAMLEQMGVTNALEVVEGHLAVNTGKLAAEKEFLALKSKDVTEATYKDIESLILEGEVAGTTAQYLAQLAFQKLDLNNLKINTVADVNNIIAIAKAAGTSEEYINKLRTALINLMNASGGSSGSNRNNNISLGKRDDIDTPSTDDGNAGNSKLIVDDILGDIVSGFDDINIADFYDGIDFGGGSSSGSGGSSAKESTKIFDWIETKLSRLQRTIKNFGKTVSATYLTWSTRNDALLSEITAVNEELVTQQKAYETYMAMANSVGLSDEYKQLVQSGDLRIDSITDETLKKQIELYTQYYEAALDCSDAIQDLTDSLAELARQKFDNISAEFDSIMSTATSQMDLINAYIDLAEAKGHLVSTNYYETLKELEQQNKESLQNEYNALQQAMKEALASGAIKEGSQEHKEMEEAIADVKKEIIEADIALQEYENTIRELEWEVFDKMQEAMSQVTEESDFLMELMSNDKMHDENGNLTDEGQAVMGLHAMNYNSYMAQADEYAKELQKIDEEIANDPNNQELLERRQELLESQREMILAAEDEKQAMLDLIREGYDAMLSSMEDLIQKKKDMFKEMSDMYDFEKNIKKQVEELDKLRKQLLAYQGDNSEGAKANIQKLEEEIRIAEENLQETEYDKYISDVEKMLDTFYSDTEQWISEQMEKEAELLQGIIDETNANAVTIKETLETQVGAVGTTLSEAMKSIWNTDGNGSAANVVSMYGDALNGTMTTVSSTLESIKALIASMVTASDETAESDIEDVVPSEPSSPTPTEPVSPPEPEEPVTPSEPTQEWGHWFIPKQNQVPDSRLNTDTSIVD